VSSEGIRGLVMLFRSLVTTVDVGKGSIEQQEQQNARLH
jgi:hypothetical protein